MKSHQDPLIEDLLEDVAPASFREKVLDQMLQKVRQRRRSRIVSQICAWMALGCLFLNIPHRRSEVVRDTTPHRERLAMTSSRRWPPEITVTTRAGSVPSFSSSAAGFGVVRSQFGDGPFADLDDERLLDLLSAQGAVGLVRYEGRRAELLPMTASP